MHSIEPFEIGVAVILKASKYSIDFASYDIDYDLVKNRVSESLGIVTKIISPCNNRTTQPTLVECKLENGKSAVYYYYEAKALALRFEELY
jgi:hypothetical protein